MNTGDANLDDMIAKAEAWYAALTPEQKAAHDRKQAISWMHGEARLAGHNLTEEQCAAIYDKHRADARIAELTHQRDTFAREIAEAAHRLGGYNMEVPLTGPQVLLLLKDMDGEVVRQRKRAALWKRMHWALLEGEFGSGGALCDQIQDECSEQIRAMGEDPEHDAGDPGVYPPGPTETQPDPETRMATAPQAGDGAEVV